MTALLGTRNCKSCGSKVACDGHAAFGLPQTVRRLVVLRCASAAETKIKHAIAAVMTVRNILDLIMRFSSEVRSQRSEVRGQISDWGASDTKPLTTFSILEIWYRHRFSDI